MCESLAYRYLKCFLLVFLLIFTYEIPISAEEDIIEIPEDKSIYLIANGGPRVGKDYYKIPLSRILKFDLEDKIFYEIDTLNTVFYNITEIYSEYDYVTINNTPTDDDYQNIYIIHTNKPWEHKIYEKYFNEYLYPQKINNQDYLVSLRFNSVGGGLEPETSIINLSTLRKEEVPLDILKNMNTRRWLLAREGKLYIDSAGLDQIKMPYNIPEEINQLEKIHLVYNTDKYFVLRSPYHDEDTWLYQIDKKNKWTKYVIQGNESYIYVINDYLVVQIGYDQGHYSTKFTGAFEIINLKNGERQTLDLEGLTKILIFEDNYMIVKDNSVLLYIPIENGIVKKEKAIRLYIDLDNGTWQAKVLYIDAAFIGPKEIPEEVMTKRAIELNKIGEVYYNAAYYQLDKAIYYFKEAIKFNPDYAQAYSNLGLAYYKDKNYEKSIESNLRAIELTDNDIIKASSYYNIAMAYEAMEEWEKALENYRKALEYRDHDAYREGIERMEEKIF